MIDIKERARLAKLLVEMLRSPVASERGCGRHQEQVELGRVLINRYQLNPRQAYLRYPQ